MSRISVVALMIVAGATACKSGAEAPPGKNFQATGTFNPHSASAGDSVQLSVALTADAARTVDIALTVQRPDGSFAFVQSFPSSALVAKAPLQLAATYAVSAAEPAGNYSLGIEVHPAGGGEALFAHSGLDTLVVAGGVAGVDGGGVDGGVVGGGPVGTPVTLRWVSPAPGSTLSATTTFALAGQNLVNVEINKSGAFYSRCSVTPDHANASCSIDTTQLPDGSNSFSAHAWNSAPGDGSFTGEADAGPLSFTVANRGGGQQTVGGGDKAHPAEGPAPSYPVDGSGYVLVKNWDFGQNGTIKNMGDMDGNFLYHDQFNQIIGGGGWDHGYGSQTVASSAATAIGSQPVEDPAHPVRSFGADSLKTFLVPLDGSGVADTAKHNVGSGSFMANWTLPAGGTRLGQDILWETRVRYDTPPYFWYAIWACGQPWDYGAEFDLIESFGWEHSDGSNNFDGRYWHSNAVYSSKYPHPSGDKYEYIWNWPKDMAAVGFGSFDAKQWHTWSMLYKKDGTYTFFCDGKLVQTGGSPYDWTVAVNPSGSGVPMFFLFDGAWSHVDVLGKVTMPAASLNGKYYEWDYSRVYLR